ncbi:MAG: gliding motility-associated C-terminal domain-containing protein, partial [Saprospiraceae bacterium]|nr:gliding motility-associated C-terminal domain-containing protein [Saprospiraceae bacterium]
VDPQQLDICEGEEVMIDAIGNVDGIYIWQPGNIEGPSISVSPEDSTEYTVQFDYGCGVLSSSAMINIVPVYPAQIICDPEQASFEEGQEINLSVDSVFSYATYSWDNGSNMPSTVLQALNLDGESITLTITYGEDCIYEITKEIEVREAVITMPNAFTPDNDGQNDFFKPTTMANIEIVNFRVWNRWGQQVYDNNNGSAGWDGYHNGEPAASDVYLFEVIYLRPNGTEESFRGDVTLIR